MSDTLPETVAGLGLVLAVCAVLVVVAARAVRIQRNRRRARRQERLAAITRDLMLAVFRADATGQVDLSAHPVDLVVSALSKTVQRLGTAEARRLVEAVISPTLFRHLCLRLAKAPASGRIEAMRPLAWHRHGARPLHRALVRDRNPQVRLMAARSLALGGGPLSAELLIVSLRMRTRRPVPGVGLAVSSPLLFPDPLLEGLGQDPTVPGWLRARCGQVLAIRARQRADSANRSLPDADARRLAA
jgi:hypothetical protein